MKTEINSSLKEQAKTFLQDYLSSIGINTNKPFSCLNPQHEDKNPSMSFDSKRNKCHCFSCGADYDIFDLVGIEKNLEGKELFNEVYKMYGIQNENTQYEQMKDFSFKGQKKEKVSNMQEQQDFSDFIEKCHCEIFKTDYWQQRGLSVETVNKFNLGYWSEKNRFLIPTSKHSYNARSLGNETPKYIKSSGEYTLFNIKAIETSEQPIFLVEGEFDALSIIEVGGEAIALGSSGNKKLIEILRNTNPKKSLIISLDNDEAGKNGTKRLQQELDSIGIPYFVENIAGEYKDSNEALITDKEKFKENVQKAIAKEISEFDKGSSISSLQKLKDEIQTKKNIKGISTGFKKLDTILDGGFYSGLYVIGAVSSLGKTTFALQIADTIAMSGHDVLVFSLEMAESEMIAKSISRISMQESLKSGNGIALASTTRNILNGIFLESTVKTDFINKCFSEYEKMGNKLFYKIGVGDIGVNAIRNEIERYKNVKGKAPFVLIDYLQILAPFDIRATDKQNMDKAVVELKRLSRDFSIPILAISSFNRENYTNPVSISSFKESGAIEYTSDVLLALQYSGMDFKRDSQKDVIEDEKSRTKRVTQLRQDQEKITEQPEKHQDIQLKILKNRNGKKGSVEYKFFPSFNFFMEN